MNDFKKLNEINKNIKKELNSLYDDYNNDYIKKGLEICEFKGSNSQKTAVLRRIVDLKVDPLLTELKKLRYSEEKIMRIRDDMYDYTRMIHEDLHRKLIDKIQIGRVLDEFYFNIVVGVHKIGLIINEMQKDWQKNIIDTMNKKFEEKFSSIALAKKFILENELYQKTPRGEICDRTYGAVILEDGKFRFEPYAVAFRASVLKLESCLDDVIEKLEHLADDTDKKAYIQYLKKIKNAFCEKDNTKVIGAWRDAEMAWMDVKGPLQIGHPLEYYEDAYTHAVALEWDIRLEEVSGFDTNEFKSNITDTFDTVYKSINADNHMMYSLVNSNIDKTQLYISNPMIYYGAELNGLFSAQVVPNDEFVSTNSGKKIFAFVNFVYENMKAKPFMKLSSEIFSQEFLNFGREILFKKPEIWRKVYEISTIGHEFGHIFFIDEDTETRMNKSGVFKFIEEYKATTGGLVNFFLHEQKDMIMPVFEELIKRSVGLIAWQKVDDVRAYYCEGLIHLCLLFQSKTLKFDGCELTVKFDFESYEKFKQICLDTYKTLARIYTLKLDASEFLDEFLKFEDGIYLPINDEVARFVKFYHAKYEEIGNEIDESDEKRKWLESTV